MGEKLESPRYALSYRAEPIAVGRLFALEFSVCPKTGARFPENVRVDASMPEHKHGMNYRPTVTVRAAGGYRAEGMMFHMPGRWELVFELRAAGRTERLAKSIVLE